MRMRNGFSLLNLRLLRLDGHHDLCACTWLHIAPSQPPFQLMNQHRDQRFSKTSLGRGRMIETHTVILDGDLQAVVGPSDLDCQSSLPPIWEGMLNGIADDLVQQQREGGGLRGRNTERLDIKVEIN